MFAFQRRSLRLVPATCFFAALVGAAGLAGCLSDSTTTTSGTDDNTTGGGSTVVGPSTGSGGGDSSTTAGVGGATSVGAGGGGAGASVVGTGGSGGAGGAVGAGGSGGGGPANDPKGKVVAGVRWVGRFDASDATKIKFGWGGSGFVAQVNVTGAVVDRQPEQRSRHLLSAYRRLGSRRRGSRRFRA